MQDSHGGTLFLLDAQSNASLALDAKDGVSGANLSGADGKAGLTILAQNSGAGFTITDGSRNNLINVDVLEDGPSVELASKKNKAVIEASSDGPRLELSDDDGFSATLGHTALITTRTGEKHETSAASLVLFGKDKKTLWSAP